MNCNVTAFRWLTYRNSSVISCISSLRVKVELSFELLEQRCFFFHNSIKLLWFAQYKGFYGIMVMIMYYFIILVLKWATLLYQFVIDILNLLRNMNRSLILKHNRNAEFLLSNCAGNPILPNYRTYARSFCIHNSQDPILHIAHVRQIIVCWNHPLETHFIEYYFFKLNIRIWKFSIKLNVSLPQKSIC